MFLIKNTNDTSEKIGIVNFLSLYSRLAKAVQAAGVKVERWVGLKLDRSLGVSCIDSTPSTPGFTAGVSRALAVLF